MATMIVPERCVACAACEPVCPGKSIRREGKVFVVDPERCMECVGYHGQRRCASVCPARGCCVQDPDRVETEEVLFERAKQLAAGARKQPVLADWTSHFREDTRPWWKRAMS